MVIKSVNDDSVMKEGLGFKVMEPSSIGEHERKKS